MNKILKRIRRNVIRNSLIVVLSLLLSLTAFGRELLSREVLHKRGYEIDVIKFQEGKIYTVELWVQDKQVADIHTSQENLLDEIARKLKGDLDVLIDYYEKYQK